MLADIPGLIEGAHEGRGVGDRFLGHIERCAVLLHLIDATRDDVLGDYRTVEAELAAYGHGLAEKPRIVALSKCDAHRASRRRSDLQALLREEGVPVEHRISAVTGQGVPEVLRALRERILAARDAPATHASAAWTP